MKQEDEGSLVGMIYEAGLRPELWRDALDGITTHLGTALATLLWRDDVVGRSAELNGLSGGHHAEFEPYRDYYGLIDPRWAHARRHPIGEVYVDFPALTYADYQRSEVWNDFWRPRGVGPGSGILLMRDRNRIATFSTFVPIGQDFTAAQADALQRLAPHLMRALRVQRQVGLAGEAAGTARLGLNHLPTAAFIAGPDAKVHDMNDAAAALLRTRADVVRLAPSGHLILVPAKGHAAMLAALIQAHRITDLFPPPPIFIARGAGGEVSVMVTAARGHPFGGAPSHQAAFIFIADRSRLWPLNPERLTQEFSLTQAEARIVVDLAAGRGVEQIATTRGLKNGTVYLHVKHALAKTGTATQAQLVARVLHGTAALSRTIA